MKIDKIRDYYHAYSGQVSDIVRQLAFAGLAVVWLFKLDQPGLPKLPHALRVSTLALLLSLLFDLLHYAYGACAYWIRYEVAEGLIKRSKRHAHHQSPITAESNFKVSRRWIVRPMDWCFVLKTALLAFGYVALAYYIWTVQIFAP